jgi:nitrogen regulatory protein PII
MENQMNNYQLITVIVDYGKGSKIVKHAKQNGIMGATICLGKGTAHNHILQLLDLTDIRKEIVLMVGKNECINPAIESISKKFHLDRPNHGIAFTISIGNFLGARHCVYKNVKEKKGMDSKMHHAIFVIVEKGKAEMAIDAAVAAGSTGGTIINARGSGIHEQKMLFSIPIEPEKEIVMILSEQATTDTIVASIQKELKIDEPGMGVLFVLDVNKTIGLY